MAYNDGSIIFKKYGKIKIDKTIKWAKKSDIELLIDFGII